MTLSKDIAINITGTISTPDVRNNKNISNTVRNQTKSNLSNTVKNITISNTTVKLTETAILYLQTKST